MAPQRIAELRLKVVQWRSRSPGQVGLVHRIFQIELSAHLARWQRPLLTLVRHADRRQRICVQLRMEQIARLRTGEPAHGHAADGEAGVDAVHVPELPGRRRQHGRQQQQDDGQARQVERCTPQARPGLGNRIDVLQGYLPNCGPMYQNGIARSSNHSAKNGTAQISTRPAASRGRNRG